MASVYIKYATLVFSSNSLRRSHSVITLYCLDQNYVYFGEFVDVADDVSFFK